MLNDIRSMLTGMGRWINDYGKALHGEKAKGLKGDGEEIKGDG